MAEEPSSKSAAPALSSVETDIHQNLKLLRQAVTLLEPRLTTKVLRTLSSVRKRLDDKVLVNVLKSVFQAGEKQQSTLLGYLDADAASNGMDVDTQAGPVQAVKKAGGVPSSRPGTPSAQQGDKEVIPEEDVYLTLLVIVYLMDTKKLEKAKDLADATVQKLATLNRRTLDQLAAKIYYFYGRLHELVGGSDSLSSIRPQLLQAQRLSALRRDDDLQATVLNLLLRNYFAFNLYDQADKLIAKTTFPDTAGNPQLARWFYYVGRIRAIQLNYTEAHSHLQQAIRRAPNASVAPGFAQTVHKLFVVVELLMGEIPERSTFRQPVLKKALLPYLQIAQAVRIGDITAFTAALKSHQKQFQADGTYTLILRLRHNVIKTALRTISLSYSRIPLQEICKRLHLDSEEEAEYVCAKAIRDGVIEASLEHEKGFMKSKDVINIYNTNEPQKAFHQRINFCMKLHNESVKGMRFPRKTHESELDKATDARDRERELAQEITENGPQDDDDEMGGEM